VEPRTLKTSPARSVRLELCADGDGSAAPRVVKRFAGRGLFAAPRDAARARREHALLVELHAGGLPVPRPLSLERRGDGWEVAMEWIPEARTLQERLLAGDTRDLPARALGALLARLQAAGVDHPDLHPGNVLIDALGGVWAIDFHKARSGARLSAARLEAQLAHLEAGLRERAPVRLRLRCLLAWLRALPADHPRPRGTPAELAARLAERARRERCATVEKRRLRWTRPGSAVRAVSLACGDGFERADGPADLGRSLEAAIERAGAGAPRAVLPCPALPARRVLVLRGTWRAVGAAWYAAARLEEHALPAARPLALARGTTAWAAFALPPEGHLLEPGRALDARGLRGAGALATALHDRGLALERVVPEQLWLAPDGTLSIAGAPRLVRALDVPLARALDVWRRALGAGI
jgi:hypothetical protein